MILKEDILKSIIQQNNERLMGSVDLIETYTNEVSEKSMSIKVTFKAPYIYTTRDRYTLELKK